MFSISEEALSHKLSEVYKFLYENCCIKNVEEKYTEMMPKMFKNTQRNLGTGFVIPLKSSRSYFPVTH